jgi:hypothetical protein
LKTALHLLYDVHLPSASVPYLLNCSTLVDAQALVDVIDVQSAAAILVVLHGGVLETWPLRHLMEASCCVYTSEFVQAL